MPGPIRMVAPEGGAPVDVPEDKLQTFIDLGYTPQSNEARAAQVIEGAREDYYSSPEQIAKAGLAAGARAITGGVSDVVISGLGGQDELQALREYNPTLSTAVEIGAGLTPIGLGKLATRAGIRAAGTGGGALSQIGRAARGAATEGAIIGAGQGVSELALSDDPLSIERISSVMGSNILLGGVTGGAVGAAGKTIGLGLRAAKAKLDDIATRPLGAGVDTAEGLDDLSKLDRKGLRLAEKTELEAIEAARVPQRAELATEIKAFRQEMKEQKVWLATKGAEEAEIRAIGKRTLKADRSLDNLLDDPKALAENPRAALSQLRKQEAALDELVTKHSDNLRAKFASDTSGDRVKALDFASTALERNRSLQAKITDLSSKPTSARLDAIADAAAGLGRPKPQGGLGEMIGDSALGYAVGAAAGIPMLGAAIGAARTGATLLKKLTGHSAEAAARSSKAIGMFLDVGAKVGPRAPVLASKVLGTVRFTEQMEKREKKAKKTKAQKAPDISTSYRARSEEIRSQVEPTMDGKSQMRMDARAKVAERLRPIAAADPLLADRLETKQADKIEYLANALPRMPDLPGMDGKTWQPSDMQMREWARKVAAVEDPMGVVERLATGEVTPEDAEVMRKVYPELYADIQAQIMMQLGELRSKLPYQRRLALSIFSGVPVDPALDPRVLSVLQGTFAIEAGTSGGIEAPKAQPAFGSVSKETATPAQERGGP